MKSIFRIASIQTFIVAMISLFFVTNDASAKTFCRDKSNKYCRIGYCNMIAIRDTKFKNGLGDIKILKKGEIVQIVSKDVADDGLPVLLQLHGVDFHAPDFKYVDKCKLPASADNNKGFDQQKWNHQYNNLDNPPIVTICRSTNDCTYTRKLDDCPAQFVTLPSGRKVWFTGTFTQDGTDGPSSYNFTGDGKDHDLAVQALQKVCPAAVIFEE